LMMGFGVALVLRVTAQVYGYGRWSLPVLGAHLLLAVWVGWVLYWPRLQAGMNRQRLHVLNTLRTDRREDHRWWFASELAEETGTGKAMIYCYLTEFERQGVVEARFQPGARPRRRQYRIPSRR
jgi:hypothetical protein